MVGSLTFVTLREAAFGKHPELLNDLRELSPLRIPLSHFWAQARVRCMSQGFLNDAVPSKDDFELFNAVKLHTFKRGGFTLYVVAMPPPHSRPEAYFAGMAFKDDEFEVGHVESPSTRYFTLEMTEVSQKPPGTEDRDRGYKLKMYARYGVPEYWIVDPDTQTIDVYCAGASDYLAPVRYRERDVMPCARLRDLIITLHDVFSD